VKWYFLSGLLTDWVVLLLSVIIENTIAVFFELGLEGAFGARGWPPFDLVGETTVSSS